MGRVGYSFASDSPEAKANVSIKNKTYTFHYPCASRVSCSPYLVTLYPGFYKMKAWGAKGGDARIHNTANYRYDSGGKGAFVSGFIHIQRISKMYLYIGGMGEDQLGTDTGAFGRGGFNGGGDGGKDLNDSPPESNGGGGGATDFRLILGEDLRSLKSRFLVAAGGGSACSTLDKDGAPAGGIQGYSTNFFSIGGKQDSGSFGIGMPGISLGNKNCSYGGSTGGGGGGYYGGSTLPWDYRSVSSYEFGGAGGSSFISGYTGCKAVNELPLNSIIHSNSTIHYSGLFFHSPLMKDGKEIMTDEFGKITTGHYGNGCASITILSTYYQTCHHMKMIYSSIFSSLLFFNIIFPSL